MECQKLTGTDADVLLLYQKGGVRIYGDLVFSIWKEFMKRLKSACRLVN